MDADAPLGDRRLLVTRAGTGSVDRACLAAAIGGQPRERDLLVVTTRRPAEAVVEDLRDDLDGPPRNLGVVDLEDSMRSVSPAGGGDESAGFATVAVSMADPRDVPGLLDAVEQFLGDWAPGTGMSVVYLDSVTAMTHRAGVAATVEFLCALAPVLSPDRRVGYFRLDSTAHDLRTLTMLSPLFDSVLARTQPAGGPWRELPSLFDAIDVAEATEATLPATESFRLLADPRRRLLLHRLRRSDCPVTLSELATSVARLEADSAAEVSEEVRSRVYTGLREEHLPALAALDVVTLDEARNTVELVDQRRVEPYLSLAAGEDLDG